MWLPFRPDCSAHSSSTWADASTPASTSPATRQQTHDGFRQDVRISCRSSGCHHRPISRRQFRLGLSVGGRCRSAERAAKAARSCLAQHRDQRFGTQRVHPVDAPSGVEPMMAVNLGTRGVQEACRPTGIHQPPEWHRPVGSARPHGRPEPHNVRTVVPGQRDGRAVADRPQDRRRVRAAGGRNRKGACVRSTPHRARRLRQLQQPRCRPSAPGRQRCSSTPTTPSTTSPARLLRGPSRETVELPRPSVGMDRSSDRDRHGRPCGRQRHAETDRPFLRRMERLVPAAFRPDTGASALGGAPRLIEDDFSVADAVAVGGFLISFLRHADRVDRREPAQLVNVIGLIRPSRAVLPGARRSSTRSRRPLLERRAEYSAPPRAARHSRRPATATHPWSTRFSPTTSSQGRWSCSPSTGRGWSRWRWSVMWLHSVNCRWAMR